MEKHEGLQKELETVRRELEEACDLLAVSQRRLDNEKGRSGEREGKLRAEVELLRAQVVEKESQLAVLTMENEAMKTSTVQTYTRGREEGMSSGIALYKNSQDYADDVCSHGSSFYMDDFSTCLEQFKNLGNLPPDYDFSFLNIRADGFGRTGGEGPSGG
ncbi:hypothetical protein Salat_1613600 [Sesamum alatum]|uniref:Uncharacterized protein n=1 Tax=Sesamum alatum TaxID=300844 RepID=A0AAE2CJ87_9LAMI|nr:hypothetical protein Salat_1613600 [Sesamum alatum]